MTFIELLILSIGLALDAFAVSLATGNKIENRRGAVRLAFHFGLFQFFMPIIGWLLGWQFVRHIVKIDHWIAFVLLAGLGIKMIHESFSKAKDETGDPSRGKHLVILSFATSIDALVIGLTLAMINIEIFYPSLLIGFTAGVLSLIGIYLSKKLNDTIGKKMEIAGGIILIGIGCRILYSHLYTTG